MTELLLSKWNFLGEKALSTHLLKGSLTCQVIIQYHEQHLGWGHLLCSHTLDTGSVADVYNYLSE